MDANAYLVSFPVDFRIAHSRILYSHQLVVTLAAGGLSAVGSGVLYRATGWQARQLWRRRVGRWLAGLKPDAVQAGDWQAGLNEVAALEPGLAFAVDAALWDLKGKLEGRPVADMLGGTRRAAIVITEQIFIAGWRQSREQLDRILARGTATVKVKIGYGPQHDLALLQRVRDFVGPGVELRVDANRAYTLAESAGLYRQLAGFGVVALEEPLRESWPALARLREMVGIAIMCDESVLTLSDLRAAIDAGAIDSLNLKLSRVGGLSRALAYRRVCEAAGTAVSIGCSEELGPGMAAILHLAATGAHYATEGLGSLRLGADIVDESMPIEGGAVKLPAGHGLGVCLAPGWQQRLAGRARVFDLAMAPATKIGPFSTFARTWQRGVNLLYRTRRRVNARPAT